MIGQRFEFQRMGLSAVADEKRTIGGIRIPVRWENPRFIWICILCSTSTVYSEKIDSADSFLSPSPRNSISAFFQRRISSFFFSFPFFFLSFFLFLSLYLLFTFVNTSPSFSKFPRDSEYFVATSVTGSWCFHAS